MDHRETKPRLPCLSCARRTLNICEPLDDGLLRQLLKLGGPRHWKKREVLFRAGDRQGPFFKITRGIVAVSRTLDDGRRQIVGLRAPGDCVGYLENDGKYDFEGQALTDVEGCAFDRSKFDAFATEHPELAVAVAMALSSALAQAGQNMLVIGRLKSTEKVANFLVELSALYTNRLMSTHPLALHLTRNEIADYLGLTLETVSRSFGKLKNRNVIALVQSDAVIILDHNKLVEIAKSAVSDSTKRRVACS
jgi:CRP/FNR family transcriptional regulator